MDFKNIRIERAGAAMTIYLSDPAAMNAVSAEMLDELSEAIDIAAAEARVLVLTGDGRGFCAGANLSRLNNTMNSEGYDPGLMLEHRINPILKKLRDLPMPWISAVNGAAVGVGCGFGLSGDLILCSESAFFMFAFGRVGLAPDGGSSYLLSRAVGKPRASEILLLGERITAAQAKEWGLINRVFPDDVFAEEVAQLAARLAAGPTRAYHLARAALWNGMESNYDEALQLERVSQKIASSTEDHREGIAAFKEKRPPNFQGR